MNKATRVTVAALGTIFGFSGMDHGFFEMLQGNTRTGGLFIAAIGAAHKMWPYGDETAFTIIPNFLVTGIAAMLVGLAVIVWSLGFVHRRNGPAVFIVLFILLLLVGGGVAQVLFFPWLWLVSTRINTSLAWWRKTLPVRLRETLGRLWRWLLIVSAAVLLFVLEIGITGYVPGMRDPDAVLTLMVLCLAAEVILLPLTFIAAFAYDIAAQPMSLS